MAFLATQFFGGSIAKASSMNILVPQGLKGPFPVLYLLHGLSDDHSIWQRRTSLERYVEGLGLIVVMPDGHRGFYCNSTTPDGLAYEDHIVKDVVGFVDDTFPTIRRAGGRAVAGLSMGGYGAMMLAMRHPDVFSVASSHSGAVAVINRPPADRPEVARMLQAYPKRKYDCFAIARRFARTRQRLHLRLDCGTEDRLLEGNRRFHALLDKLGLAHEYTEFPGSHTWEYWDRHVGETISFVMKHVAKK